MPTGPPTSTIFNTSKNHIGTMFSYWEDRPKQQADFAQCMKGYAGLQTSWTDIYPTDKLVAGGDDDDVVVVDVGGSVGHDLKRFQAKHALAPGRLVLQDQAGVIQVHQVDSSVKTMVYDFFTPQPIKGARAYYLHSILHDWPDEQARQILENIKPAMEKGKSKILIHEITLLPQGNAAFAAQSDLLMMTVANAGERTLEMWEALVEQVGLKVVNHYTLPAAAQGILEVKMA